MSRRKVSPGPVMRVHRESSPGPAIRALREMSTRPVVRREPPSSPAPASSDTAIEESTSDLGFVYLRNLPGTRPTDFRDGLWTSRYPTPRSISAEELAKLSWKDPLEGIMKEFDEMNPEATKEERMNHYTRQRNKLWSDYYRMKAKDREIRDEERRKREAEKAAKEKEKEETMPRDYDEIRKFVKARRTEEMDRKYVTPFNDPSTRCHPSDPETRCISQEDVSRMKQLMDCFPIGVSVDHFLKTYRRLHGKEPELFGYNFPKDDDSSEEFKLPAVFWIPDHEAHHLPAKLLFSVETSKKYGGSLKAVLNMYWDKLKVYMESKKRVWLSELFDFQDRPKLFYAWTQFWFGYQQWGLTGYIQFFELLVENFDPKNKLFTIITLPPVEPGSLRDRVYLVISGVDGRLAREFEESARANFRRDYLLKAPPKPPRRTEDIFWEYEKMNFLADQMIREDPESERIYEVVAAGDIWHFGWFHVIFTGHVKFRDHLLEQITELTDQNTDYTLPARIIVKNIYMFPKVDAGKRMWRRGLVMRTGIMLKRDESPPLEIEVFKGPDGKEKVTQKKREPEYVDVVELLDIDTGETDTNVPVDSLRTMTLDVYNLKVVSIPVRFSFPARLQHHYKGFTRGDRAMAQYLHKLIVEPNMGMRLRFHWFDDRNMFYTPGMWVVSGHLIDVLEKKDIRPRVSIPRYIWTLFKGYGMGTRMDFPGRLDPDDWDTPLMQSRSSAIFKAMEFYYGMQEVIKRGKHVMSRLKNPTVSKTSLKVDPRVKDEPLKKIFVDVERGGADAIPTKHPDPNEKGIRRLSRYEQIMGGINGTAELRYGPDFTVKPRYVVPKSDKKGARKPGTGWFGRARIAPFLPKNATKPWLNHEDSRPEVPYLVHTDLKTLIALRAAAPKTEQTKPWGKGLRRIPQRVHYAIVLEVKQKKKKAKKAEGGKKEEKADEKKK